MPAFAGMISYAVMVGAVAATGREIAGNTNIEARTDIVINATRTRLGVILRTLQHRHSALGENEQSDTERYHNPTNSVTRIGREHGHG
jgi:hypothetical protein